MPTKSTTKPKPKPSGGNFDVLAQAVPEIHLLQSGMISSAVSSTGAGGLFFEDLAVTRWRGDPTSDAEGFFVYLRDLDSGEFWSTGYQPTLKQPDEYKVHATGQTANYSRTDHQIHSSMEVCLDLNSNTELRCCTITNHSPHARRIELTSYAEIVLQAPEADNSHPAFSKLFIETEQTESGALVARRRKREASEEAISAIHFLTASNGTPADEFETDRKRFIGRGRELKSPIAMESKHPLSGTVGSTLDPVFSLRKEIFLPPNESARITFGISVSRSLKELSNIAERFSSPICVDEAFAAANKQDLPAQHSTGGKLWRLDTSPASPPNANGDSSTDFALFNKKNSPPCPSSPALNQTNNTDAAVSPSGTSAAEQLDFDNGLGGFAADGTEYVIRVRPNSDNSSERPPMPWVNTIANPNIGFIVSESGAGYTWSGNSRTNRLTPWQNDPVCDPHSDAIYIRDDERDAFWSPTPGPVTQNADFEVRHGFGYTKFTHTSHQLRQEVTQFVPCEDAVKITCVRLENQSDEPRHLSVFSYHQWDLSDGNQQARQATVTEVSREHQAIFATNSERGEFSKQVAFAALSTGQRRSQQHYSGDRREFLGQNGRPSNPLALQIDQTLSDNAGSELDPCAACQSTMVVQPGESIEFVVLLGESTSKAEAASLIERYSTLDHCHQALSEVQSFWRNKLSAVKIRTPSPALDLMVNGWLPYQNLSCRLWGRSSTYQSGGAYGFRDQLQDAAALIHHWPALTRQQILRNAAHQFVEGDVLHWWHPPKSRGIRTHFSDDLLWLPLFAAEYVNTTGDNTLWHEQVRFLEGPAVPEGEQELMLEAKESKERGSLYEHCCRALDRGLTTGQHGLPLMGCGDWNDGMSRVGKDGLGESVWLGFFIDYILELMLPICEQFEDQQRLLKYNDYRTKLRKALNDTGWDGEWYRRAYFDDGTPLGTATGKECQIDALVQAWAVLSKAVPPERAAQAMAAAEERLVDEQAGLIQLLDPPFDKLANDPGYIKGYLPGIRENGGQYTHGVLWFIRAVAELGHGSRAVELLEMLSPINHARTPAEVSVYQTEPYVVAADVYSQAPHAGRGGWSWYTGSAGWMWRVAVESIMGIRLSEGNTLIITPRISTLWPECQVDYRLSDGKTLYQISIQNPLGREHGVTQCELDGQPLPVDNAVASIPLSFDGSTHQVVIKL